MIPTPPQTVEWRISDTAQAKIQAENLGRVQSLKADCDLFAVDMAFNTVHQS